MLLRRHLHRTITSKGLPGRLDPCNNAKTYQPLLANFFSFVHEHNHAIRNDARTGQPDLESSSMRRRFICAIFSTVPSTSCPRPPSCLARAVCCVLCAAMQKPMLIEEFGGSVCQHLVSSTPLYDRTCARLVAEVGAEVIVLLNGGGGWC